MTEYNNNKQKRPTYNRIIECCAYFGVACIAISLILATCFQGANALYNAFKTIGDALAYLLSIILAGYWVRRQRHIAWLICYIVFVVVIVVLYVIGLVNIF